MTPLRILTVAGWMHPDAEGGSFRFIYELNRALAARGHQPTVLTQRLRSGLPESEELGGIRVLRYRAGGGNSLSFYGRTISGVCRLLRRTLAAASADGRPFHVLHLHHPASAFAARLAAPPGLPMVHTLHIAYFLEYLDRRTGYAGAERAGGAGGPAVGDIGHSARAGGGHSPGAAQWRLCSLR